MNITNIQKRLSANKLSLITSGYSNQLLSILDVLRQKNNRRKRRFKVLIRKATLNDLFSINALCHEQLTGSHSNISHSNKDRNKYSLSDYNLSKLRIIDLLFTESLLKEKLNNKNVYFFVAETKKKTVVGYLMVSVHAQKRLIISQHTPQFYAYIERFYVSYKYHGKGIELALLNSFDYWKKYKSAH